MGRPSDYTEELADYICGCLIEGTSLRQLCSRDDMPDRGSIFNWLERYDSFSTKYARARELQGHYMDDLVYDTARSCTSETAQADRVKIAAFQWRAAKLAPKKYGERITQENVGADGGPMQVESTKTVIFLPRNGRD